MIDRVREALGRPVDAAWLAAFRILFGLLMFTGLVRFVASGWVQTLYVEPSFFFKYWGFEWVQVPPTAGIYALYAGLALLALCIAAGLFYRVSCLLFVLGFSYAQLLDLTNYLNHYYLVVLLAGILALVPAHRLASIDAWRTPALRRTTVPAWALYLLRFQVAVVYFYAALAKVGPDWLLHGQPLSLWTQPRSGLPLIGALFDVAWVPLAMSWAGFLYDLTIPLWLSLRRTRPFAYALVCTFHGLTYALFEIGMFPFIMTLAALLFFPPDWPRHVASRVVRGGRRAHPVAGAPRRAPGSAPVSRLGVAALALYALFQVAMPLRHLAYPGDVLWNEQGMRFAWKVMVREKHGALTYHVRDPRTGKQWQVSPARYLTPRQEAEMASQPDMILQLAHHVAADFAARGVHDVEVRAETHVSLNGRRARPMIDPAADLAHTQDGLGIADWVLPAPDEQPFGAPHSLVAER